MSLAKIGEKKPGLDGFQLIHLTQAFFLTSAAEKTKTQGQNSSKKLKEKTQPLGATLLKFLKTQEKNSSFNQISRGTP